MFTKLKQKIEKEAGHAAIEAGSLGDRRPIMTQTESTGYSSDGSTVLDRSERDEVIVRDDNGAIVHKSGRGTAKSAVQSRSQAHRLSLSSEPQHQHDSKVMLQTASGDDQQQHHVDIEMLSESISSSSKEELRELVIKKTQQVAKLENKVLDLRNLLKEKNHTIDKLESTFEKQQDVLCQRVQELNEQYHSSRAKMSENIAAAVSKKEQDMKYQIEELEKRLSDVMVELSKRPPASAGDLSAPASPLSPNITTDPNAMRNISSSAVTHSELERHNADLRDQLTRLKIVNSNVMDQLSRTKADYSSLQKQLKASSDAFAQMALQTSQDEWLEKQIENEKTLSTLDDEIRRLKAELAQRDSDRSSHVRQLSEKTTELTESRKKVMSLDSTLKTERQKIDELQRSLAKIQQQCEELTTERIELQRQVDMLKQECESHESQLSDSQSACNSELAAKALIISELQEIVESHKTSIVHLHQQLTQLQEGQLSAATETVALEKLREEVSRLETQLQDKNRVIKKQEQRLVDMKKLLQRELKVSPNSIDTFGAAGAADSQPTVSSTLSGGARVNYLRPSESVPNLNNAGVSNPTASASKGILVDTNSAATLPVSYSVTHHSVTYNGQARGDSPQFHPAQFGDVTGGLDSIDRFSTAGGFEQPHNGVKELDHDKHSELGSKITQAEDFHNLVGVMNQCDRVARSHFSQRFVSPEEEYDFARELNFKYLRHVVLKFLLSRESEALQLLKALSMLLHFTNDEQKLLRDTLEWKMSWFGVRPQIPDKGQSAKVIPPTF